ncbi:hypothetical protein MTR_4g122990 [Medicago truncatula]|uniref:Uncharacterized protein n=1 Tax=Medicago truncatula TaxID=3880 RepID=A0A072URF6_MEDTR|nr:hypothetical protein MTR_4g122990 [Medicago truncatula]
MSNDIGPWIGLFELIYWQTTLNGLAYGSVTDLYPMYSSFTGVPNSLPKSPKTKTKLSLQTMRAARSSTTH